MTNTTKTKSEILIEKYIEEWWKTHSKKEIFQRFELEIRFMFTDVNTEVTKEDLCNYSQMLLSLLVFAIKDEFNEDDKIFLNNVKIDFYDFLKNYYYNNKVNKTSLLFIKKFAEHYIFKDN